MCIRDSLEGDLVLEQGLSDATDIAVAEDAEDPGDEAVPLAVAFDVLLAEESHDGLPLSLIHI